MKTDIPSEALQRIEPILQALEQSFRPIASTLTYEEEPAVVLEEEA